ncbi:MAG: DUF4340 domain-containing protein [Hyphomicrobiales bacterium]|nr:MAG: DUF4340 domain-containing protein [Hyphomicrobiales bacterium]
MKPSTFAGLIVATVVVGALAVTAYQVNNRVARPKASGTPLVANLASRGQQVAKIEIRQGDGGITLARGPEGWYLADRGGYPAKTEPVKALLVRLAEADLVEPKTRVPDRFGLLELEDPATKGAKSRLVRLLGEKGNTIAEVIVGKKRVDAFGASRAGTYVRRPGDEQTWLASADIDASANVRDWVQAAVLDLPLAKVNAVTVSVPGEEPLKITRDAAGGPSPKFNLAGLPEDKKLKEGQSVDAIARSASTLDLDDVRKADTSAQPDAGTVTIESDGGLKVVLALRKAGDDTWATVTATGDGDAKAQAEEITKKTAGWEYKLPSGKAAGLLKRRADLVEGS